MTSVFTCTACAETFADPETHKNHYKLDWHRYNLKRKVAGLSPVDRGDFERRVAAALGHNASKPDFHGRCKECRKNFRSEGLYEQHLHSKKHKDAVKAATAAAAVNTTSNASSVLSSTDGTGTGDTVGTVGGATVAAERVDMITAVAGSPPTRAAADPGRGDTTTIASSVDTSGVEEEDMEMSHSEEEKLEERDSDEGPPPPMGPHVCVFCDAKTASFEDNCAHMLRQHGFFIPDVEYLTDPEGLVRYAEEKVKLGNICLYCNGKGKAFRSHRALQQHMADRSHCKLLYDEDEDMHEYEAFYDFSASYRDAEKPCRSQENVAEDADAETDSAMAEEKRDDVQLSRTLGVTDIGELVLLDGRTVGNRKWNRYYKQRLRTVDAREVAVAQRKATSLRLGAMYETEMRKGTSTAGAVALQRGERKAYGGLPGVSRPKDVKMLRAHQRVEARGRLKTALRQNKLNKTFDRVADM